MKRSEKLLDAIGQIDDKLVTEAAQAGRTSGSRAKKKKKKKKKAKIYRWQGALAACAVLAVCVGVVGLLNRSGMLLGPLSSGSSGAEEMAMDASAQDAAAGSADSGARSAEAVPEAAMDSAPAAASQSSEMAEAVEGNEEKSVQEAADTTQSGRSAVVDDSVAAGEDGGISAQSVDQEDQQNQQQKEGADTEAIEQEEICFLPPGEESVQVTEPFSAGAGPASLTIKAFDGKSVTFLVKNTGEREIHFGEAFELERYVNEGWEKVIAKKAVVWNDVDILVGAGDTYEETIILDSYYGTLQPGRYRIVKVYLMASDEEPEGQESYSMYGEFTVGE